MDREIPVRNMGDFERTGKNLGRDTVQQMMAIFMAQIKYLYLTCYILWPLVPQMGWSTSGNFPRLSWLTFPWPSRPSRPDSLGKSLRDTALGGLGEGTKGFIHVIPYWFIVGQFLWQFSSFHPMKTTAGQIIGRSPTKALILRLRNWIWAMKTSWLEAHFFSRLGGTFAQLLLGWYLVIHVIHGQILANMIWCMIAEGLPVPTMKLEGSAILSVLHQRIDLSGGLERGNDNCCRRNYNQS